MRQLRLAHGWLMALVLVFVLVPFALAVAEEDAGLDPATTTVVVPPDTDAPSPSEPVVPTTDPPVVTEAPTVPEAPVGPTTRPAPADQREPVTPQGEGPTVETETTTVIPLKAVHAGASVTDGQWPHNDPDECADAPPLEPGEVCWHIVLTPVDGATVAGTTLTSAQWGLAALPADKVTGGSAHWTIVNTHTTAPTDMTASTDGAVAATDLRVSHTCGGGEEPAVGSLAVVKLVAGDGAPAPGTTFTVQVTCGDPTYDETLVFDETGALLSGTTPLTDLPVGLTCTVTETTTGGGEVTYAPNGGTPTDPPTVTIVEDQEVTVTVTNTFREDEPLGALGVVKVIGEGPEPEPGAEFTIEVDCSVDSFDTTLRFDETGALISGTTPIFGLPLGTTCTVTETGEGGATGVVYDPYGTFPEDPPTVTVDEAALVTVTVTNTFTDSGPVVTTTLPDDDDDDDGIDDGTAAPERPGGASGLARTGANVFGPVALAGALVGGGYGLLAWRRRLGQR